MMRFNFGLRGGEALTRALARLDGDLPRAVGAALFQEAEQIMAASKRLVPVDMGALRASGHVREPEVRRGTVTVRLGYGSSAAPYALYVHEGTGPAVGRPPFFPPVSKIRKWVVRHGMDERLAFVVARAIGRRGLRPTKFLERPLKEAQPGMGRRLAARLRAWVERQGAGRGRA